MKHHHKRLGLAIIVATAVVTMVGCGTAEEGVGGQILPHQSPVQLGSFYPQQGDPDFQNAERTPFEWVLLLEASGGVPVNIEEVCLIGPGKDQWLIEGPRPQQAKPGEEAAVRLTYQRKNPGGPDHVAVVVQSDAENFPTLVVPACAQVVADGAERVGVDCESPVEVPAGTRDDSLCP